VIVLLLVSAALLASLVIERVRLGARRAAIPLRIAVTGTRGKSTVTRMLASVLRADDRIVVAKTTGTEPVIILPDGSERAVRRRGPPSIIEQKRVIHLAAELNAAAAVIEVMSIHPENHRVESRLLLQPHMVLVTNFRVDHTAALGSTRSSVAEVLALDVPPGAQVLVPAAECEAEFRRRVAAAGASLIEVPARVRDGSSALSTNEELVRAAAERLGVGAAAIQRGIAEARYDSGALRVWRVQEDRPGAGCLLINAFAANDPESTALVYDSTMASLDVPAERCIGLLNLRADRADRTLQWLHALAGGMAEQFGQIIICGDHAFAASRRLRRTRPAARVHVAKARKPADIMDEVWRVAGCSMRPTTGSSPANVGAVVFGFGNIGGRGTALVRHWAEVATPVEW
jgi:gamma-polyglutamate synthase